MRKRLALAFAFLLLSGRAAHAVEPVPGDACGSGGVVANTWQWAGGQENGGVLNGMFCNGSVYTGIINFQSSGNVGIGTTSPTAPLHVVENSAYNGLLLQQYGSSSSSAITMDAYGYLTITNGNSAVKFGTGVGSFMLMAVNGAEIMRLYNGAVGIGTTSPQASLDVAGEIRTTGNTLSCVAGTKGAIRFNSSTNAFDYCGGTAPSWTAFSSSVTPAGSDQQVQINSQGALYASMGLTYNSSTGVLTASRRISVGGSASETASVFVTGGNATATGDSNVAVGTGALPAVTSGGADTVIGAYAGTSITTANHTTAVGDAAMYAGTGAYEAGFGDSALYNAAGNHNAALGFTAGASITSGSNNTAIGDSAAASTLTTGSGNILVGAGAYPVDTPAGSTSNFLNIGNIIFASGITGSVSSPAGNVGIGTTGPQTSLDVNGAMTLEPLAVSLTADNTLVTVTNRSYLQVTSNNATATNRTMCLTAGGAIGQTLIVENMSANKFEIQEAAAASQPCGGASAGTNFNGGTQTFATLNAIIELIWDGVTWVSVTTLNSN